MRDAQNAVVVAVRWAGESVSAVALAAEVRAAIERAAALGAALIGVSPDGASFGFDADAVEEAVDLAVALVEHGGADGARFRVGVGVGELAAVRDVAGVERLSVGPAAQRAGALARIAAPGEVLVDATASVATSGALLSLGRRVATLGEGERSPVRLRGLVLDVQEPWRRDGIASVARVHRPRVVGREASLAMIEAVEPGGVAIVRAAPGVGGTRFLEEIASRAARAVVIEPVGGGAEPLGALRVALARTPPPELPPREAQLLDSLLLGRGLDVVGASDLLRAWFEADARYGTQLDERAWVLLDDPPLVDRATLEAIGHAASVPGTSFALVVRLDPAEVMPSAIASLVIEADLALKPLQPHEATAIFEEACGGKAHVSPDVVRRWVRRGAGVPLAILEGLRHGLSVGELAVRKGEKGATILPRSRVSGRGRVLSAHAWIARRLAVLDADRPDDALVLSIVSVAGPWISRKVIAEAALDLRLSSRGEFDAALDRLVREAILLVRNDTLSTTSRTMREVAAERLDEGVRRTIHAALAAALARDSRGLDLAEGAHHAALAGDHLGASALATRAEAKARIAGLDRWADSLAAFARAEGAPPSLRTSPAPARPRRQLVEEGDLSDENEEALESLEPPPASAEELELEEAAPTLRTPEPPPMEPARLTPPPPIAPPPRVEPPRPAPPRPAPRLEPPRPPPPRPAPRIEPQRIEPQRIEPLRIESRPSIGMTHLTTGQIAALPAPPAQPPADILAAAPPVEPQPRDSAVPLEALMVPSAPPEPPLPPEQHARRREGLSELATAARSALESSDLVGLEAALNAIEVVGGSRTAVARLRGIAALARGKVDEGIKLVRAAKVGARSDAERARGALACAIGFAVAGDRDAAVAEAVEALATERRHLFGAGDRACVRLLERLLPDEDVELAAL